ncbi:ribonuclease D [Thiomicrorhabdus arctica]|uniref:ribonuclease D n=1 Tax=Thiomicrorhabdus arctica TaxID=131540 RepID=UPI0003788641|nr:HRDC domain-containing protein [Thiomicrorhabdus arctica]
MKKNAYISVETEFQLHHYCQQIIDNPDISWVAIDTEFVRVDTYFAELSLVQIQDCLGQMAIIDPILITQSADVTSGTNPLRALTALLTDPNTLKVFHSARQDIEVLYQLEDKMPVSIFDTQLAALFLKHGEMAGFARVIKEELGVIIDKSQTRTNWHHRPLTPEQIEYALDDVRYLSPLYEQCLKSLTPDEIEAVTQDCAALLDKTLYTPDPENAGAKVKGIKAFKAKQLAIVNTLATWRENFAMRQNQPKKWVMDDDVITHIAKRPPITMEALYKVPQIKSSSVKVHGAHWVELIDEVFQQSPDEWPKPAPKVASPTLQEEAFIQLCMAYAQQVAIDYRLNLPSLINRNDILTLLRLENSAESFLKGWRNQLIGKDLISIKKGLTSLNIEQNKIRLIPEK